MGADDEAPKAKLLEAKDLEAGGTYGSVQSGGSQAGLGLSSAEAARLLEEFGPNELDTSGRESFLSILLTQAKNVIFLLTVIAAILSYGMGSHNKAYVLLCLVCFVCLVNTIGEYTGQDAGGQLSKLTASNAMVYRDGTLQPIEAKTVVPGDVIKLTAGEIVPADMRVLESVEMHTSESVLTGEPNEVLKTVVAKDPDASFPTNMVYSSTGVVTGSGLGVVVSTGMKTQVGIIAQQLQPTSKDVNPLQNSINLLGGIIGVICLVVVVTASTTGYLRGYQNPSEPCRDDDDQCLLNSSILQGLLMAVSIIPHGLPLVVTIMLRVGAMEMGKKNAIVIRKTAVDYLGAVTVVCSDKTGTLTEGRMTATELVGFVRPAGTSSSSGFEKRHVGFYPLKGFNPAGGVFPVDSLTDINKTRLDAAFSDKEGSEAAAQVASDFGAASCTEPGAAVARVQLAASFLGTYGTSIRQDETGRWESAGSMTEAALKVAAAKCRFQDGSCELTSKYPRMKELEIPFSSLRKFSVTVHRLASGRYFEELRLPDGVQHFAVIKGAPDNLIRKLRGGTLAEQEGAKELSVSSKQLSDEDKEKLELQNLTFARQALRSILIALTPISEATMAKLGQAASAEDRAELLLAEAAFLGIFGICDPPRTSVPGSVSECHVAGVRVVMITGDQQDTAEAIGTKVNILFPEDQDDMKKRVKTCTALHRPTEPSPTAEEGEKSLAMHTMERQASDGAVNVARSKRHSGLQRTRSVHNLETKKGTQQTEYLPDEEIDVMSAETRCWARAQPTDKVALVESLRHQGHIVSMTGDGVNDAPALKKADVGVAMGISGTAVAQNAADIVLADDNFSTIVAAIKEGRKIYANVQKYVLFNLSIKGGECMSLLFAILLDLPFPIAGLQLLFNLIVTHIIPTFSLAFESPEAYTMQLPPRNSKRDYVITRTQWLFRWFPFIMSMAFCVLSCTFLGTYLHVGYVETWQLIGTSKVGFVETGKAACEFAGRRDRDGTGFIEDKAPFHCVCYNRDHPWEPPARIEEWGADVPVAERERLYDPYTGSMGDVYKKENTPFRQGVDDILRVCKDDKGIDRWCWVDADLWEETGKPLLDAQRHCAAWGTKRGQTMSYVAIHLGEILTLLTYRRDGFALPWFFSNRWYVLAFVFNVTMLFVFLYAPPVAWLLKFVPLPPWEFAIGACFAVLLACINEVFKSIYRLVLGYDLENSKELAAAAARGQRTPWSTDATDAK
eukprot:TRINITY_DN90433_c0_g1_i1.p1 TRINITY_DN90433_c0_g1~~TRINITY_DN90433_c0_g1_i1.p1  ORF type:complete len:1238 (-),score=320.26 TRINITY_DN90433_c0_g1_i1:78-3791(-)